MSVQVLYNTGPEQNHDGIGQPEGFGGVGERGVGGDGKCAERESAVFQPDRAQNGKAERH